MLKVSKQIREKILSDKNFSSKIAEILGIKQVSVELLARRNSRILTQYALVKFYIEQGYTEKQIFEQ